MFQAEIDTMGVAQKEKIMQVTTSWEEKGIEKGIERERQTIALNMLQDRLPIEQIARLTQLTIVQIQQLQSLS